MAESTTSTKPGEELITWSLDNATLAFTSLTVTNEGTAFNFSSCKGGRDNKCSFLSNSTVLGELYQLNFLESGVLRFYLSTPSEDWRVNQTYAWKLSQSWVAERQGAGYFFWNVENHINSGMIIPPGYSAFSCDLVELSYFPATKRKALELAKATLIATDFLIGFGQGKVYNPCGIGNCRSINGAVTCGNAIYWQYSVVGIIAFSCMFCWIWDLLRSRHASLWRRTYSEILPHEEGIEMKRDGRWVRQVESADWDDDELSTSNSEVV